MGPIEPWRIPAWPRKETLEGTYGIVRNLRSIYDCKNDGKAQQLLGELTRRIELHRESLQKVEKFAYDLVSAYFSPAENGEPSESEETPPTVSPPSSAEEEPAPVEEKPKEKKSPEPVRFWLTVVIQGQQLGYPSQIRFSPGQEIKACIEHALSPLEFHIIQTGDLERRRAIQAALTERLAHLVVLEQLERGPCAVFYRKAVYRGMIQMSGTSDVLICLVDYGTCHFVSRKHVYHLPEDIRRLCQPLAYFCCLADTEKRWTTNAVITDFSKVSTKPDVLITACGSLRDGNREIVYLPAEEQKSSKTAAQQHVRKKVKKNHGKGHLNTCPPLDLYTLPDEDGEWEEDEFPTLCDPCSTTPAATTTAIPSNPIIKTEIDKNICIINI